MSTKDNYRKTLRFSEETDEKLEKLALKYGYSKFQFFNIMVDYFYRTKKDPADLNDAALAYIRALKKAKIAVRPLPSSEIFVLGGLLLLKSFYPKNPTRKIRKY